jgi:hypothetical protein
VDRAYEQRAVSDRRRHALRGASAEVADREDAGARALEQQRPAVGSPVNIRCRRRTCRGITTWQVSWFRDGKLTGFTAYGDRAEALAAAGLSD